MSRNLGSLLDDQWVLGGDDETLSQIPSTSNLTQQHTGGIPDSAHPLASCKVTPSYRPQPSGGEKTTVRKRDKRAPPSFFDPTASSSERGENLNSGAHPGRPLTTFGSGRERTSPDAPRSACARAVGRSGLPCIALCGSGQVSIVLGAVGGATGSPQGRQRPRRGSKSRMYEVARATHNA
ncbi:hypothetical protein BGZ61DRAFT_483209 [Ilyonectria robusta]|uniref:uncharacterized protein n=1 Tax=Ilyonectria robusta TaxID=1079257 RepID=UPI001E8DC8DC|nr:uncharacterized protein BGZ61DRAFT_483209 [Ilyonectria robusta]KAH8669904.1 hypothetical protein BGZ61DRAFT_483209 [Ilyonectria robusta]